ncbi:FG-GAP-like repeat-containing protein [Myxococcota bacterium]|nr:FG-GAP-like repeat-containing protein [Myxococcota bacterium]
MRWWSLLLLVACEARGPDKGPAADLDGDGHLAPEDCDDDDPQVNPAMPELCDDLDNDCNSLVDDSPVNGLWVYDDADGDGFGVGAGYAACGLPDGAATRDGDCDDGDAERAPGLTERCDSRDNDCDGRADEDAVDAEAYAADVDGDGWGDGGVAMLCAPLEGLAPVGDCDDADPTRSPDGVEVCDGVDQDCDDLIDDEPLDGETWEADLDGDGWGAGSPLYACDAPAGYGAPGDCDDSDSGVSPSADELCDGVDQDCDGELDESAWDAPTWALDLDGDGFGDPAWAVTRCDGPAGYVPDAQDCDDSDPEVSPLGAEICGDGVDGDCDGRAGPSCGPGGDGAVDEALVRIRGASAGDAAAYAVSFAGDLDGDGLQELLIGAPSVTVSTRGDGAAYLVLGESLAGDLSLADADATLSGAGRNAAAGTAFAAAGDWDNDGLDDLWVGASTDGRGGASAGAVSLVTGGARGALDLDEASLTLLGDEQESYLGGALSRLDLNGDGAWDLGAGAIGDDRGGDGAGAVFLLLGDPSGALTGALSADEADLILIGESAEDRAGAALSSAGDVDGDGLDDLLVGAWGNDTAGLNAGAAYLLLGGSAGVGTLDLSAADAIFLGEAVEDYAGFAVAGGGDSDGDGYADLLIGARSSDRGGLDAGATYWLRGPKSGTSSLYAADAILVGEADQDYAGYSLAAGDINGDGLTDAVVGAHYNDRSGSAAGAVFVFYELGVGVITTTDAGASYAGAAARDTLGAALAVGDWDGDGVDDLLLGAPGQDDGGAEAGGAYLILGGLGF